MVLIGYDLQLSGRISKAREMNWVLVNSYFFFLVLWSTRTKKTCTAFYLSQLVLFTLVNSYFIIGQVVLLPNRTPFVILRLIRADNCIQLWSNQ